MRHFTTYENWLLAVLEVLWHSADAYHGKDPIKKQMKA